MKISILLNPIKHIPLPDPGFILYWVFFEVSVQYLRAFFVPYEYFALSYFLEGYPITVPQT